MTAGADLFTFEADFDFVLADELLSDSGEGPGIVGEKIPDVLFREHDAKTKVSSARVRLFHPQAEVKLTGNGANHHNLHVTTPSTPFSTLVIAWERGSIRVVFVAIPLTAPH